MTVSKAHNQGVDVTNGVAVALMRMGLQASGRLRNRLLFDSAVCGALLVDLVLDGRVSEGLGGPVAHPAATRMEPADDLQVEIAAGPPRELEWWLNIGRPGEAEVAEYLVHSREWDRVAPNALHREPRYRIADAGVAATAAAARRNLPALLRTEPANPQAAALACIVLGLGLGVEHCRPGEALTARCESAGWVVRAMLDYFEESRDAFAARQGRSLRMSVSSLSMTIKGALEERHYH